MDQNKASTENPSTEKNIFKRFFKNLKDQSEGKPLLYRADFRLCVVIALFVVAFLLRLNYMRNTDIYERQHDIGNIGKSGHLGYIDYIYQNEQLPDFDVRKKWQFYHPPLHHAVAAAWVDIQVDVFGETLKDAMHGVGYLTVAYSMLALFAFYKTLKILEFDGLSLYVPLGIMALHPTFVILAGSYNNDCLAVTLAFFAIYFVVKWYKKRTFTSIMCLGLSIGLAMMTKLSFWYLAPATALLFLWVLVTENNKWKCLGQYAAFGACCIPFGLFWPIRNYVGWNVPFAYVPKLKTDHIQYIGFRSTLERLFDIFPSFAEDVYVCRIKLGSEFYEYNLFTAVAKSSVFGEFRLGNELWAWVLLVANIALMCLAFGLGIWIIVKKIGNSSLRTWFTVFWVTVVLSYGIFAFTYPHDCSMDFRYIVPTLAVGGVSLACYLKNGKSLIFKGIITAVAVLFCVGSMAVYGFVP